MPPSSQVSISLKRMEAEMKRALKGVGCEGSTLHELISSLVKERNLRDSEWPVPRLRAMATLARKARKNERYELADPSRFFATAEAVREYVQGLRVPRGAPLGPAEGSFEPDRAPRAGAHRGPFFWAMAAALILGGVVVAYSLWAWGGTTARPPSEATGRLQQHAFPGANRSVADAGARADRQAPEQGSEAQRPDRLSASKLDPLVGPDGYLLVAGGGIRFAVGSAALDAQARAGLIEVAGTLKQHPEIERIWVEGHTDGTGPLAVNMSLSHDRATVVRQWLIHHGVEPGRVLVGAAGPHRPRYPGNEAAAREANRRVEFRLE